MVPDPIFFNLLQYTFFLFGAESMFFYMVSLVSDTCFLCDARSTHVFFIVSDPIFLYLVPDLCFFAWRRMQMFYFMLL